MHALSELKIKPLSLHWHSPGTKNNYGEKSVNSRVPRESKNN